MASDQIDSAQSLALEAQSLALDSLPSLRRVQSAVSPFRWSPHLTTLAVALLALCVLFRQTLRTMAATWHSGNYSHGYLIIPIACWLIWRERASLRHKRPSSSVAALAVIALLSMTWLVGELAQANLIQQLSVVAMIPAIVWAILGRDVALDIWFPLFYLIFAVPMGDSIIPRLQDLTAWFTVSALQASGIPALLDGRLIYLSSGTWEVAQACSGIRYLISSLVLGVLFAHFVYRSWRRKLVFLAACVVVPILANWIRAYSIVLFAHKVNRELAVGVDHVIYGWLFCCFVTVSLFSVALSWRERGDFREPEPILGAAINSNGGSKLSAIAGLIGIALMFGLVHFWDYRIEHPNHPVAASRLSPISLPDDWNPGRVTEPLVAKFTNADAQSSAEFSNGQNRIQIQAVYYTAQRPGATLISASNGLDSSQWREVSTKQRRLGSLSFNEALVEGFPGRRIVWYWYWVDGRTVASSDAAKLYRAKMELLHNSSAAGAIFISASADAADRTAPEELLAGFVAKASLTSFFDRANPSK
jgi:exosortase A